MYVCIYMFVCIHVCMYASVSSAILYCYITFILLLEIALVECAVRIDFWMIYRSSILDDNSIALLSSMNEVFQVLLFASFHTKIVDEWGKGGT